MSRLVRSREVLREPYFRVEINGSPLSPLIHEKIVEVMYEDEDEKLDMCRITFEDTHDSELIKTKEMVVDVPIKVWMGHRELHRLVLDGKITHIDVDFRSDGIVSIVISAVDKAVDMVLADKYAFTWENKKLSTIIEEIISKYGFTPLVEDTKEEKTYSKLKTESDMEFITRWAKELGWKFYKTIDGAYYFGTRNKEDHPVATLEYYQGECSIIDFKFQYVNKDTSTSKDAHNIDAESGKIEENIEKDKEAAPIDSLKEVHVDKLAGNVNVVEREKRG